MGSMKHFIHREQRPTDPAFLHEERRILNAQFDALHLMERERDQLQHDIEAARQKAHGLGISLNHAPESGYRALARPDRGRQPLPPRRRRRPGGRVAGSAPPIRPAAGSSRRRASPDR